MRAVDHTCHARAILKKASIRVCMALIKVMFEVRGFQEQGCLDEVRLQGTETTAIFMVDEVKEGHVELCVCFVLCFRILGKAIGLHSHQFSIGPALGFEAWLLMLWFLAILFSFLFELGVGLAGFILSLLLDLLLVCEAADGLDEIGLDSHFAYYNNCY